MRVTMGWGTGLCAALLLLAGCDRPFGPEEEEEDLVVPGASEGTFEAEVGALSGGGYERLEGRAVFEWQPGADGRSALVVHLLSTAALPQDSSWLAFARVGPAAPATYAFADPADDAADFSAGFAAAYRGYIYEGEVLRSESGTLTLTGADARHVKGSFDLQVYVTLQVGPDAFARRRLDVEGTFHALPGRTGLSPGALF